MAVDSTDDSWQMYCVKINDKIKCFRNKCCIFLNHFRTRCKYTKLLWTTDKHLQHWIKVLQPLSMALCVYLRHHTVKLAISKWTLYINITIGKCYIYSELSLTLQFNVPIMAICQLDNWDIISLIKAISKCVWLYFITGLYYIHLHI